jgi:hypothetical protein
MNEELANKVRTHTLTNTHTHTHTHTQNAMRENMEKAQTHIAGHMKGVKGSTITAGNTTVTPLYHRCNTVVTPVKHQCDISVTPL